MLRYLSALLLPLAAIVPQTRAGDPFAPSYKPNQAVHPIGGIAAAKILNASGKLRPGTRLTPNGVLAATKTTLGDGDTPPVVVEESHGRMRVTEIVPGSKKPVARGKLDTGDGPAAPVEIRGNPVPVAPKATEPPAVKAPTATTLTVTKTLGRMFDDPAGNRWAVIYGMPDLVEKKEIEGWLMPHSTGTPHFYAKNGCVYMMLPAKKK